MHGFSTESSDLYLDGRKSGVAIRETTQCSHSYSILWSHAIIIIPWIVCVYSTQLLLTYYVCSCVDMLSSYGGYPTASRSTLILNQGNKHSRKLYASLYDKPYYYSLKVKLENKQIRPFCIWCTRRTQIHVNKVSIMNSWIQGKS